MYRSLKVHYGKRDRGRGDTKSRPARHRLPAESARRRARLRRHRRRLPAGQEQEVPLLQPRQGQGLLRRQPGPETAGAEEAGDEVPQEERRTGVRRPEGDQEDACHREASAAG